ncbi:unnamed protein product [Linum tenue]|uniref:Protein kinase domain-containing protein n=1 Tax=Linum tenue TaxID=586396 RepID=A0AAV0PR01_9ROSI|nr:unnamed protein product [Linum tenue]
MSRRSRQKNKKNKTMAPTMVYDDVCEEEDMSIITSSENSHFIFTIDTRLLIDPRLVFIHKLIGEGNCSRVYAGMFESKPVAVKVIQPMRTSDVLFEHKERFEREVTIQSKTNHPNIVQLVGASVDPAMFLITELMSGGTLQKYLLSVRPSRLDLELSLSFALDISRAMEYLHDIGIIHRDLKPGNLLLTEDHKSVKVGDFGLAKELMTNEMTCEAGTYRWMAPEVFSRESLQIGTKKHYDHKVDVYSFAIILWELLTNESPYKGRNMLAIAYAAIAKKERPSLENLPNDVVPLLQSCWSEDPSCRPEFTEITRHLEDVLERIKGSENSSSFNDSTMATIDNHSKSNSDETKDHEQLIVNGKGGHVKKSKHGTPFFICFNDCLCE